MRITLPFSLSIKQRNRSTIKWLIGVTLLFSTFKISALNYYWVGNSGNWSDLSHWATTSGGSTLHVQIPTALDDVFFDSNSFSASGQVVNFDAPTSLMHSLNWTDATGFPHMSGSSLIKIYGSLTFIHDLDITDFTGQVNFESTSPGQTVVMAGQDLKGQVEFDGVGGEWTFQDEFTTENLMSLNAGTLNFNGHTINVSAFYSDAATARSLNMDSSVVNVSGSNSNSCWIVKSPGLTLNCGTSVINFNNTTFGSDMAGDNNGNLIFYDVNFAANVSTGLGGMCTIIGSHQFHKVHFHCPTRIFATNTFDALILDKDAQLQASNTVHNLTFTPGYTYTLWSGTTQTIIDTLNASGSCGGLITVLTNTPGSAATISHATDSANIYFGVMRDIHTAGGAVFTAFNSTDLGNNTGWTFSTAGSQNLYWIGGTGNWDDVNHWAVSSGGSSSGCLPDPTTNVFFDNNSFPSTGDTVYLNSTIAYCRNMNWSGVQNGPTFYSVFLGGNILKIYGSLEFSPAMLTNLSAETDFEATTPGQTIKMAGQYFNWTVYFNGIGGGWTLLDEFTAINPMYLNGGALDFHGSTVNASAFYSSVTTTRSLNMDSSVFNISGSSNSCWIVKSPGLTLDAGTSTINFNNAAYGSDMAGDNSGNLVFYDVNFVANGNAGLGGMSSIMGSHTFHNVHFQCPGRIFNSNTFDNLAFDKDGELQANNSIHTLTFTPGYTYTLWSGKTQNIVDTLHASGSCGGLITILSNTSGSAATISHAGDSINVHYTVMRDIHSNGGAIFTAFNSTDLGNNTGWTFSTAGSQNLYWIGGTGNWDDINHWSMTSGGTSSGCLPTPTSNVFFDANSFPATGDSVYLNAPIAYCRNMSWAGVFNGPTFYSVFLAGNILKIYGSLEFSPNMITNLSAETDFEATTSGQTIRMAGQYFNWTVYFNGIGGGWTLQDEFNANNPMYLNAGALDFNGQTGNVSAFSSSVTTQRSLNMGSSVVNISASSGNSCWIVKSPGLTLNCGTSIINFTNPIHLSDMAGDNTGNLVFYDVNFAATVDGNMSSIMGSHRFHHVNFHCPGRVFNGNTFDDLSFDKDGQLQGSNNFHNLTFTPGYTYTLWNGTTQAVSDRWLIQGTCTSYIVLQTNNSGSSAIVTKAPDSVLAHNVHIRDIHCTGGAKFMAYNSVDLGGNTGWQFTTLQPLTNPGVISGSPTLCSGTVATYSISPVQGAIYYQWSSPTGSTIISGQGDTSIIVDWGSATAGNISVLSYNGCNYSIDSSTLFVTLATAVTPTVYIVASDSSVCPGAPVTFTATASNIGSANVMYQFMVNGVEVQNSNSTSFTTTSLSNNDVITCNITLSITNSACFTSLTASSNAVAVAVGQDPNLIPSIHITGITIGTSVSITSAIVNGGSAPAYQWQDSTAIHYWQNIFGETASMLNYTPQQTGDKVRCRLVSDANCSIPDTTYSNALRFDLDSGMITITGRLYPNPVHTALTIDGLVLSDQWETAEIFSQNGARQSLTNIDGRTKLTMTVQALAGGEYYILLRSKSRKPVRFKFIKL